MKRLLAGAAAVLAVAAAGWAAAAVLRAPADALALGGRAACAAYGGLPPGWGGSPTAGMRRVRSGSGHSFWIDTTEVTNAQFAAFVQATGYVTEAERSGMAALFEPPRADAPVIGPETWWRLSPQSNWRRAQDGGDFSRRLHEPVSLVTRADAQAYAAWRGNRLPTESEWEAAAHSAEPRDAQGRAAANFWQGFFPIEDRGEDGFHGLAPVGCYAANAQGLYDTIGNVWEWTDDDWNGAAQAHGHGAVPGAAGAQVGVIKGGSWLCAANYCQRYRANARHPQEADLATAHVGFRTARD